MKHSSTILAALLLAGAPALAAADLVKAFSFTVTPDGNAKATISGMYAKEGSHYSIDWGDGVLTDAIDLAKSDDWDGTKCSEVPKGTTITVYTEENALTTLDGSWATGDLKWESVEFAAMTDVTSLNLGSNALKTVNVSTLTALTSLTINNNDLKGAIDLSANSALTTLNLSNSATLGTNNTAGTDYKSLTNLTSLNISYQTLQSLDVAGLTKLKTLNITSCGISDLNITGCSAIATLNANDNNLEGVIDLSGIAAKPYIFLNNNKLTGIKTAESLTKGSRMNCKENYLTFSTLPAKSLFTGVYNYYPQKEQTISALGEDQVDLSALMPTLTVDGTDYPTIAKLYDGETELAENTDYTVENGVFTLLKSAAALNAKLTNGAFENLTIGTNSISIIASGAAVIDADAAAAPAEYFSIDGRRVNNPAGGLFIRRAGSSVTKVIR